MFLRLAHVVTLLVLFPLSLAHIVGTTGPDTYHATKHSEYHITFNTADQAATNEDLFVAFGLQPAASFQQPTALGDFVHGYDLENHGHGHTGGNSFTVKVPIHKDRFTSGAGEYILTSAVTNAAGPGWNLKFSFFNTNFTVRF